MYGIKLKDAKEPKSADAILFHNICHNNGIDEVEMLANNGFEIADEFRELGFESEYDYYNDSLYIERI